MKGVPVRTAEDAIAVLDYLEGAEGVIYAFRSWLTQALFTLAEAVARVRRR